MSEQHKLIIIGTGVLTPHFNGVQAWVDGVPSDELVAPTGEILDRRSRRRASNLMKGMADVYQQCLDASGSKPESVGSIFGSALGEARTMIGLLDQMWDEKEAPSPMAFATSVHNAASGAVSIGTKNRAFTTSIAADYATPAMSLIEAYGLLRAGSDGVIVVCGDEAAPEKIVREDFDWDYLCVGLALTLDEEHPNRIGYLTLPTLSKEPLEFAPALSGKLARNPQAGLLELIDAIATRKTEPILLDGGQARGWSVRFHPDPHI